MRRFLTQLGIGCAGLLFVASLCAAPLGTAFTYQAHLKNAGLPFSGPADLTFRLYDAPAGGTLLGTQTLSNQNVQDGLITVTLNTAGEFGVNAFDGNERWLEIEVDGEVLSPRQPLTASPYAMGLRPGTVVQGSINAGAAISATNSSSVSNSSALLGRVTTTTGNAYGVWGETPSTSGSGVWGNATAATGNTIGVLGTADSATGAGVRAFAMHGNGTNYAIRGHTFSASGYAGYFTGGRNYFEGRVGIGTDNPQRSLHVAASANPEIRLQDTSGGGKTFHLGISTNDGSFRLAESGIADRLVISSSGMLGLNNTSPVAPLSFSNTLGNKISLWGTSPTAMYGLGIQGNLLQIYADGPGSSVAIGHGSSTAFTESMRVLGNGNVGIGTSNPQFKFDVFGVDNVARFDGTATFGTIVSITNRSSSPGRNFSLITTGTDHSAGLGKFIFRDVTAASDRMCIDHNGNVGIGTNAPVAKLDVIGTTRTQVLQITGGSDIAEPYNIHVAGAAGNASVPADNAICTAAPNEIRPGMVVSIDPSRIGELRIANRAYDSTVAGVISGANGVNVGLMLTQEGSVADGKHPVAMSGRVWCMVDADANGAIRAGDLLTTSDTPGHAMRASDRNRMHGAVIGKAMSSLENGQGLVLVLVNLQ